MVPGGQVARTWRTSVQVYDDSLYFADGHRDERRDACRESASGCAVCLVRIGLGRRQHAVVLKVLQGHC